MDSLGPGSFFIVAGVVGCCFDDNAPGACGQGVSLRESDANDLDLDFERFAELFLNKEVPKDNNDFCEGLDELPDLLKCFDVVTARCGKDSEPGFFFVVAGVVGPCFDDDAPGACGQRVSLRESNANVLDLDFEGFAELFLNKEVPKDNNDFCEGLDELPDLLRFFDVAAARFGNGPERLDEVSEG